MEYDETCVRQALMQAWSPSSARQWTKENPALGQCNVTAAMIHDLFGGDILRTQLGDVWHYYNRTGGERVDFTDSQFTAPGGIRRPPVNYQDELTTREAAMTGIPDSEYEALRSRFVAVMSGSG